MTKHLNSAKLQFWAIAAILIAAAAFGGGGSKYGMANLLVLLTALTALAFHRRAFFAFWIDAPHLLRGLILASIALPALYLIPLPPSLWQALPGRELVVQSLELLSDESSANAWRSASVEPVRTLLAISALITPLALIAIGWTTPRERLITAGWIIVALGICNALIGIPQVLSNSEVGVLYPENPMPGVLFGTFANRNSTGLFLVATLTLAAFLPAPAKLGRAALGARIAICALLIVAIILTRSRTALVLAILPLGVFAAREVVARLARKKGVAPASSSRAMLAVVPIVLVVAGISTLALTAPGRVGDVIERFDSDDTNARAYIWEDAAYSTGRFWPVGAGTGTFSEVFQVDESLENMTLRTAGRAHNDYIEVAIELGLPGLVLTAAWLIVLGWLSWKARTAQTRWIAWSGSIILLAIALQSVTDYPLRNQTLLAVGGFAILILARFGRAEKETER